MKAFAGYDEVKVNNFNNEILKVGGHYCKILGVEIKNQTSQKTGQTYDVLVLKIDITDPDEQAGFYERKFKRDADQNALNAKWKGYMRITIPTDNSDDSYKSRFKGFTTSVENSNPGYKWNWDERTLVGKKVGIIFGMEEFQLPENGKVISFVRGRFFGSTEKINEVKIPSVKLLDGTYMPYEEYEEKQKNSNKNQNLENSTQDNNQNEDFSTLSDDELPF